MRGKLISFERNRLRIRRPCAHRAFDDLLCKASQIRLAFINLRMLTWVFFGSHPRPFSQGISPRSDSARSLFSLGLLARLLLPVAAASICASLTACSTNGNNAQSSQTTQTTLSAAAASRVAQVTNFGASISCGYYASPQAGSGYVYSQRGYAGQFDSSLGVPSKNLCRPGDQAADTVRTWVMPHTTPALDSRQLYTIMVGTNDVIACGTQTGCMSNWLNAITAAITWMALPANDKVLGSSLSNLPPAWVPDLDLGVATTEAGASLSFPVTQAVAGRTLYIAYRVFDAQVVNGGTATVQVDGSPATTLNTIVSSGHPISTANGLHDTIYVAAIPLGAEGVHNIAITTGKSGGFFSFQWAGVSSGNYAATPGAPRVMAAALPPTKNQERNAAEAVYNKALANLISSLTADGMYVTFVHSDSVLDIATDMYDDVHPNDSGHQKIAAAFENAF